MHLLSDLSPLRSLTSVCWREWCGVHADKKPSGGELWGLASHPSKPIFGTAGDDGIIIFNDPNPPTPEAYYRTITPVP